MFPPERLNEWARNSMSRSPAFGSPARRFARQSLAVGFLRHGVVHDGVEAAGERLVEVGP
jgi:hypothetical protein